MVLELVGAEFCHEADAAAFLLFVEEDAGAEGGDLGEGQLELQAAVAAEGAEDVASEALGMDADEWRGGVDVAHDQGYQAFYAAGRVGVLGGLFAAGARGGEVALEPVNAEVSPAGGEVGFGDLEDFCERHGSSLDAMGCGLRFANQILCWNDNQMGKATAEAKAKQRQRMKQIACGNDN